MNPPNSNYDTNWTAFPHTFHLISIMALKYWTSWKSPWKRTAGFDLTSTAQTKHNLNFKGKQKGTFFNLLPMNLKKQSCQISVLVSQHPSCAHPVPCVITPREWLSRCEGCGWDRIRRRERVPVSPDNWCLLCFGGICAAPVDRSAPHLLPNISCLFFHWSPGPLLQPPHPQVTQVHEKAPCKLFSPSTSSWTLKHSAALRLICYLGHPLTLTLFGLPP